MREPEPFAPKPPPTLDLIVTLDDVSEYLNQLRRWAGNVSYPELTRRINAAADGRPAVKQTTVYDCFRQGRRRVDPELIVRIGAALGLDDARSIHLREVTLAAMGRSDTRSVTPVRTDIPRPVNFTGRSAQLEAAARALRSAAEASAPPMLVIEGPAGVGKTALAQVIGHRLLQYGRCRDAQLLVDLRGFDPDRPPAGPKATLVGLLSAVGVPEEEIHARRGADAHGHLWRTTMADAKALLILDNATDVDQVRQLLPDSPGCVVLVTSRRRFPESAAARITLDPMATEEALELLGRFDPHGRVEADSQTAVRLAEERCFNLPLDLAALGARLSNRQESSWTLADHLARLDRFPADEVSRPALAGSYHALPVDERDCFRMLSLLSTNGFTAEDAAALCDTPVPRAGRLLRTLVELHLLEELDPGHYGFHDAVRAYSRRLRDEFDPASAQTAARDRLYTYHRDATRAAMRCFAPFAVEEEPVPPQSVDDTESAIRWLDAEHGRVIETAVEAVNLGDVDHAARLSRILFYYLDNTGRRLAASTLHGAVAESADPANRGWALHFLGVGDFNLGRLDRSEARHREALRLAEANDDRLLQSRILGSLGTLIRRRGDLAQATVLQQRSWRLAISIDSRYLQGRALTSLGTLHAEHGRFGEAMSCYRRALPIARQVANPVNEIHILGNLGALSTMGGDAAGGVDYLTAAANLARRMRTPQLRARMDELLGWSLLRTGDLARARRHFEEALSVAVDLELTPERVHLLSCLGEITRRAGDPAAAVTQHLHAAGLLETVGDREAAFSVGVTQHHLGLALTDVGRHDEALAAQRRAVELLNRSDGFLTLIDAHLAAADLLRQRNEPEEARHHQAAADRLRDNLPRTGDTDSLDGSD